MTVEAKELLEKIKDSGSTQILPVTVVTLSPFVVTINGADVPAVSMAGMPFSVGARGYALYAPPLPPLCFSTHAVDTDWIDLDYASGYSAGTPGQLAYRTIGNVTWLRGGATHPTSFTAGASLVTVTDVGLPAASRPVSTWRVGTNGSNRKPFALEVRSDTGHVQLAIASEVTGTQTWGSCTTVFPTD